MTTPGETMEDLPPLVCHEDEHLLAINKPSGWNTHAPDPFAGEGAYDWLKAREPRWANLAIIHRLDKETSGLLLFSKTRIGNQSLTRQFTNRSVSKRYLLLTDHPPQKAAFEVTSNLVRVGAKQVSRPAAASGQEATTRFRVLEERQGRTLLEATPLTGRTHQIRVHASDSGIPIVGDTLYGGSPAGRLHLHAEELRFTHPATEAAMVLTVPCDFDSPPQLALRSALIPESGTTAYRLIHGGSDGWPAWYVDRLGDYLVSQAGHPLPEEQRACLESLRQRLGLAGAYHKRLTRHLAKPGDLSAERVFGDEAPGSFEVLENGVRFEMSLQEGYSTGLFLDQRDNRRRLLIRHVAAGFELFPDRTRQPEVLNTFAYTCGFSVCAAQAGARVTSLDLSRKYLEWGKRNFALNQMAIDNHDFIFGDAFDWMRRFSKRGRRFDLVLLDPPTFSRSRESGTFQAEKDYGKLVKAAVNLLRPNGVLFCSTNAARMEPERFQETVTAAVRGAGREIERTHYSPQPPDHPVSRDEPAYLKTLWLGVR